MVTRTDKNVLVVTAVTEVFLTVLFFGILQPSVSLPFKHNRNLLSECLEETLTNRRHQRGSRKWRRLKVKVEKWECDFSSAKAPKSKPL